MLTTGFTENDANWSSADYVFWSAASVGEDAGSDGNCRAEEWCSEASSRQLGKRRWSP